MTLTLLNKSIKICCMSIEIFATKFPNVIIVMERPKRLTITLLHVGPKLHVSFLCPHF